MVTYSASADGDPSPTTLGCVFRPQSPPEHLAVAARTADDAGVDELWLWEDCFAHGGIASAAIALANSQKLTVGIGVLPVPLRNVALTAMEIATLERAFPGRLRVGVGHGVQDWMGQAGARVASPLTLLREYLECLRALLRGDVVTYNGRYVTLEGVRLDWIPEAEIPLLSAAGGPRTLQLSGELASGTILTGGTSPEDVRAALAPIALGQAKNERLAKHAVVVNVVCATGPDAEMASAAEIRQLGLDTSAYLTAHGDADQVARSAQRWVDAGASTVVLQPTPDADVQSFVTFVGGEVRPRFLG